MEQLVLLIVIGLISLINWLMQQAAEARERRKAESLSGQGRQSPAPAPTARVEEDPAESMRKLMEALGLPVEEEPPPLPRPTAQPPPPKPPTEPPPLAQSGPAKTEGKAQEVPDSSLEAEKQEAFPLPQIPQLQRAPDAPPQPRPAMLPRASFAEKGASQRPVSKSRVRELLASPAGLRDAVILSEILGRPHSLRN